MLSIILNLFKRYSKPYIHLIIFSLLLQIVQVFFTLYLPNLNAQIIDIGILNEDATYIQNQGFWMMILVSLQILSSLLISYFSTKAGLSFGRDIRKDLYSKIQNFSTIDVNHFGAATLITRVTNDIQHIITALNFSLSILITLPIILIGSIIMAITENLLLSMIIGLIFSTFIPLMIIFTRKLKPLFELFQKQFDSINGILKDQITGVQTIKALVKEKIEFDRFKKSNKWLYDLNISIGKLISLIFPTLILLPNLLILLTMWYGGILINIGDLNVGEITAFITYMLYISMALTVTSMILGYLPQIEVSAERITEVLNKETTTLSPSNPIHIKNPKGIIKFESVNFKYSIDNLSNDNHLNNKNNNNKNVLKSISFIAKPSETTGIIGNTASGKSTLLQLIPRFYDVTEGTVSFDDVDVKKLNVSELNSYISFTPQKTLLFKDTIAENLRLSKNDATEDEIWEALEIAQIADFVRGLDKGLEFEVSQGGINLSGGQKQRLSIARSILPKPKVIIFDDSFSALDYVNDLKLRNALTKNIKNSTIIIVSQRISTIRDADNILVMDNGEIVSQGRHEDLIKNCEIYQKIVSSQLDSKEHEKKL
ncbi:MAG: ABC transporter ATP-binding protein/permease [Methanobrevibacter sp.]|nr:ABC transporter ATP-binding protein/permease [Candidatus Methanovirga basalitermitum]